MEPDRALGDTKSMSTEDADGNSGGGEQYECPECGDTFDSEQGVKIHYGVTHEGSIGGVKVECSICGESKRVRKDRADCDRHFCSTGCEKTWRREMSPENHPKWNGGKVDSVCETCDEPIKVWPSHKDGYDYNFCDEGCKREWMGRYLSGPNSPTTTDRITIQCAWCGADLKRLQSQIKHHERTFCDKGCMGEWMAEARVGENSSVWKGGLVDYGPGWNEQKREQVRERDSYECQMCGLEQSESVELRGRRLDIHHITPARQIDDPETRNRMGNLVALCLDCHMNIETMAPLLPAGVKPE